MDLSSPPGYVWLLTGAGSNSAWRPDPEDLRRLISLPEEPRQLLEQYVAAGQLEAGPCCWFDRDTRRCRYYEHRPQRCRKFELGSSGCLDARLVHLEMGDLSND